MIEHDEETVVRVLLRDFFVTTVRARFVPSLVNNPRIYEYRSWITKMLTVHFGEISHEDK